MNTIMISRIERRGSYVMSNFQWKKKRRIQVCKAFVQDSDEEEEEKTSLPPSKLQKLALAIIEDNETASKRLQQQGVTLAENERSVVK